MGETSLSKLHLHIQNNLPHIRSLLIARHGNLVFEKYYQGLGPDDYHNIHSATKSITSALIGIALCDGYINNLDQKIIGFFPEYSGVYTDPRIEDITVKHLLTMSSGIDEGPLNFTNQYTDAIKATLEK